MTEPIIAVVIPVLNEQRHLADVVSSLRGQMVDRVAEILIVDGGSTDATLDIARHLAKADPRIRVVNNPKRIQSAAVNLAVKMMNPQVRFLIRVDAHAVYPAGFIGNLIEAQRSSGAQSVVNRLLSRGSGCFQQAAAVASNSKFGTGGAVHRSGGAPGFVDHGHHALFDREWFERVGGYDESFVANEDAEFDIRLQSAGGRIWFTDSADVIYYPRETPFALARQYFRYGKGRAGTYLKHGGHLRVRQLVPPVAVFAVGLSVISSPWHPWALLVPMGYLFGVALVTSLLVIKSRSICAAAAVVALPTMHFAWGAGFLCGLAQPPRARKLPVQQSRSPSDLTS